MSPGFQKAGAPSHASILRGAPPTNRPGKVGMSESTQSPMLSSNFQTNKHTKASKHTKVGNHLSSTSSNLAPYSKAHTRTRNSTSTDTRVPTMAFYNKNATMSQSSSQAYDQGSLDQQHIADSMANLSLNYVKKSESMAQGRGMDLGRPTCTSNMKSGSSKYAQKPNGTYPISMSREYSVSYKRRANQVPMEQAGYREYLPFLRSEFRVGAIIRMNIHESDFKGTSKEAIAKASQASTLVEGGTRYKEHRHHGDFGPIYSENRIFIVVNVAKTLFSAIPLFTHGGYGLAKLHPDERQEYISVKDHRQRDHCQQQSEHQPLSTAYMNPQAGILNAVSTAWIPFAFPCRFDVPVAYQGALDHESAERLVRLHQKTWNGNKN